MMRAGLPAMTQWSSGKLWVTTLPPPDGMISKNHSRKNYRIHSYPALLPYPDILCPGTLFRVVKVMVFCNDSNVRSDIRAFPDMNLADCLEIIASSLEIVQIIRMENDVAGVAAQYARRARPRDMPVYPQNLLGEKASRNP